MKEQRAMRLLHSAIEDLKTRGTTNDVINYLFVLDFREEELIEEFGFTEEQIDEANATQGNFRDISENYTVTIEEMVSDNWCIKADSPEEARDMAIARYKNGEFTLDPGVVTAKRIMISNSKDEVLSEWEEF